MCLCRSSLGLSGVGGRVGTSLLVVGGGCGSGCGRSSGRSARLYVSYGPTSCTQFNLLIEALCIELIEVSCVKR